MVNSCPRSVVLSGGYCSSPIGDLRRPRKRGSRSSQASLTVCILPNDGDAPWQYSHNGVLVLSFAIVYPRRCDLRQGIIAVAPSGVTNLYFLLYTQLVDKNRLYRSTIIQLPAVDRQFGFRMLERYPTDV